MSLIEWNEDYNTGIIGVDHEHQELVKQVNAVITLIDSEADKSEVIESLGDIYGSIAAHFALEEQIMEKHRYPQFEEHRDDHNRLLDEIREITLAYENAEKLDRDTFRNRLDDWFRVHFSTHDARLHSLARSIPHEEVPKSVLEALIRKARESFLGHRRQD